MGQKDEKDKSKTEIVAEHRAFGQGRQTRDSHIDFS